jgi:hypothetical protein
MPEFMDLIETMHGEAADINKLFGEGVGSRTANHRLAAKYGPEKYGALLKEALDFIGDVYSGRRPVYQLREALGTSDFPYLFAEVIDRQLLAAYRETPATFRTWARVKTVPDFRTVKRKYVDGGDGALGTVAEYGEYPQVGRTEGEYGYSVSKYGASFEISWETLINDDLDALKDQPARFGRAARRTEERTATAMICDSSGPNSTFFASGNYNLMTSSSALSVATLTTGVGKFGLQTDAGGEPIFNQPTVLMVPPQLEVTALNILNALTIEATDTGGTAASKLIAENWMKQKLKLVVNYYLPIINTTNGSTAWYLFADPNEGRGAVEVGFLRGHEEPEVFMKAPNAVRVGGSGDQFDGDFDHDATFYKVRHVIGGTRLDPKYAVAATGAA